MLMPNSSFQDCNLKDSETSEEVLDAIASDLRSCLPPEAVLPSEIIRPPAFGKVE